MQLTLAARRKAGDDPVGIKVAEQQDHLEEEHARRPHRRRSAEPRQDHLADHRLYLKEQEGAEKYCQPVVEGQTQVDFHRSCRWWRKHALLREDRLAHCRDPGIATDWQAARLRDGIDGTNAGIAKCAGKATTSCRQCRHRMPESGTCRHRCRPLSRTGGRCRPIFAGSPDNPGRSARQRRGR